MSKVRSVAQAGQGDRDQLKIRRRSSDDTPLWAPASPGTNAWVEVESSNPEWSGYSFRLEFAHADGSFVGVTVRRQTADARPLTARQLRSLPIGRLEIWARRWVADFMTEFSAGLDGGHLLGESDWQEYESIDPERAQTLAYIAALYVRLVGRKGWLAEMERQTNFSRDTIPGLISEARRIGVLTQTTRGKAGGSLTERGRRLLGQPTFDPKLQEMLDRLEDDIR